MTRARTRLLVVAGAALSVAAATAALAPGGDAGDWDPQTVDVTTLAHMTPAAAAIPAWQVRTTERPADGLGHEGLGRLYMRHGSEAGDDDAFLAAEAAFRAAIDRIPGHVDARLGLARALAAQHRFGEARAVALELWEEEERLDALAILADAALETGEYDEARDLIGRLAAESDVPAASARLARLRELEGRHEEALRLLELGAMAARDANALGDRMSWYLMRLADLHLKAGHLERAAAHADVAVAAWPEGLGARVIEARVLTAQERNGEAIAAYEALIERMPHPEILAALGDLYAVTGDTERAQSTWAAVLVAGDAAGAGEDRPMARFLADHDLRPGEAVMRAERDLELRPDVHAWDHLAWALLKDGRVDAAAAAMEKALALGTREADLLYHAGMIASARGDLADAETHLADALALAPTFDPLQAPRARQELQEIRDTLSRR